MGKFEVKQAATGFVFNLKAGNGEIIGDSEVYATMSSCNNGIASVAKNAPIAELEDQTEPDFKKVKHPKFEVYADKKNEFRFRLRATNGEIILTSEGYAAKVSCLKGIESVRKNADSPTVKAEE